MARQTMDSESAMHARSELVHAQPWEPSCVTAMAARIAVQCQERLRWKRAMVSMTIATASLMTAAGILEEQAGPRVWVIRRAPGGMRIKPPHPQVAPMVMAQRPWVSVRRSGLPSRCSSLLVDESVKHEAERKIVCRGMRFGGRRGTNQNVGTTTWSVPPVLRTLAPICRIVSSDRLDDSTGIHAPQVVFCFRHWQETMRNARRICAPKPRRRRHKSTTRAGLVGS